MCPCWFSTARGHRAGLALSFYTAKEKVVLEQVRLGLGLRCCCRHATLNGVTTQVEELLQGSSTVEAETEAALGEAVITKDPIIIPYGMKVGALV